MDNDFSRRTGRTFAWIAALVMLGLLWLLFNGWVAERNDPNAGLTAAPGANEWVLKRNRQGHYVAPGFINGQRVTFLLDTGATLVAVPAHMASALDLRPGAQGVSQTANGNVAVYATRIGELQLGPFLARDVRGSLNPGMRDDVVLLGMSVLKNLEFTQRGDTLILRAIH